MLTSALLCADWYRIACKIIENTVIFRAECVLWKRLEV